MCGNLKEFIATNIWVTIKANAKGYTVYKYNIPTHRVVTHQPLPGLSGNNPELNEIIILISRARIYM